VAKQHGHSPIHHASAAWTVDYLEADAVAIREAMDYVNLGASEPSGSQRLSTLLSMPGAAVSPTTKRCSPDEPAQAITQPWHLLRCILRAQGAVFAAGKPGDGKN
jgi:hypothetical protein